MWAHQFAEALHTSERLGLERFQTMQNQYSLVYREEEREMLPLCEKKNVGVIPWSPLAKGFLTRPHDELSATVRGETDRFLSERPYDCDGGIEINERVEELADEYDATMAQISLAWLLDKEWVDAPIVGTTSVEHLEDAVEAVDIDLDSSDVEYLEEPYEPVAVTGHE
jgi:aryl-alcohol dehydrogenase-like predicted oxidoreductase